MATGYTDDLEQFIYGGDWLLPEKDSFSVDAPTGVVRSAGGVGWQKSQLQFVNAAEICNVTYVALSNLRIDWIRRFLHRNRGQAFLAMLPNQYGELEERVCQYLDDTAKFTKTGFNGEVSLKLQVEPTFDACYEEYLDFLGECIGDDIGPVSQYVCQAIEALPNE